MQEGNLSVISRLRSSIVLPTRIENKDDVLIFCKIFGLQKEDLELIQRILVNFVFTPNFKSPKALLNSELYKFGVRMLLAVILVTHGKNKGKSIKAIKEAINSIQTATRNNLFSECLKHEHFDKLESSYAFNKLVKALREDGAENLANALERLVAGKLDSIVIFNKNLKRPVKISLSSKRKWQRAQEFLKLMRFNREIYFAVSKNSILVYD